MAKPHPSPASAAPPPIGNPAPPFDLKDQHGQAHRLQDYRGQWVALYFYPKDDTSGCTKQACGFRDDHPSARNEGLVVLGVSPDDEASHAKFAHKYSLPFPLLADTQKRTAADYGVWQEKSMYGRKYMGVVRTTFLIDPQGRVAHRWDKVKVEGHSREVLERLASCRSSPRTP